MTLSIKLDIFEGPFDLLCHLLDENQVDIYDIPIAEITRQYLAYLDEMRRFDLEVASEFLVLAATLVSIKTKMLLPRAKPADGDAFPAGFYEEEDPRTDLVRQILEYKKYKELAVNLADLAAAQARKVARPNEEAMYAALLDEEPIYRNLSLDKVAGAMEAVLERLGQRQLCHTVERENITIKDQMRLIEMRLSGHPDGIRFEDLCDDDISRLRVIVIFLALLEMIRQRQLIFLQNANCGDIYLFPHDRLGDA